MEDDAGEACGRMADMFCRLLSSNLQDLSNFKFLFA